MSDMIYQSVPQKERNWQWPCVREVQLELSSTFSHHNWLYCLLPLHHWKRPLSILQTRPSTESQNISAWCVGVYLCVRAQQLVLASVPKLQLMQFLIWNSAPNCWPGKCFTLQITFDQTFREISLTQIGNKCISLSVIFICSCVSATVYIKFGRTLSL